MIEFTGYISGAAEAGYRKKGRNQFLSTCCFAVPLFMPLMVTIGRMFHSQVAIYIFCGILLALPLWAFVPPQKNVYRATLPKKIVIDEEHLVALSDQESVSRLPADVTKLIDRGEYYEFCFQFGKASDRFICQKDLLSKGTLEELEAMFAQKLVKK